MFLIRSILLATVSILGSAHVAHAQIELQEGIKVRITVAGAPRVTGVLRSITPDSLKLYTETVGARFDVARASVESIEISHGRSAAAGAKKGALRGGVIFGVLGAMVSGFAKDDKEAAGVIAFVAAEGVGIGALVGALVKSEKRTSVPLNVSVGATSSLSEVSLHRRFGIRVSRSATTRGA